MTGNREAQPDQKSIRRIRPSHVPVEMLHGLDTYNDPRMLKNPLGTLLDHSRTRPIYWNDIDAGFRKGCWVLTRAEDIRKVLLSPDFRNNNYANLQALVGEKWPLIPTGIDGDVHRKYRAIMSPWFSAKALERFSPAIDTYANSLVDAVIDDGRCEFCEDFARRFPTIIFLELMGLPIERMNEFLKWEHDMLLQNDWNVAATATEQVLAVLRELIDERRAVPREDLATNVVQGEIEGRPLNEDEMMGILFGFYLGGLDTVTASLTLQFHELATNASLQERLRDRPEDIPAAVEELLRAFSPVAVRRQAMVDTEIHGMPIKAGDWISMPTALASLDPEEFDNPLTVDIDRKNKRHFAFITGIHFCLGHILARRELEAAISVWTSRVPPFRIDNGEAVEAHGGNSFGFSKLPITWT